VDSLLAFAATGLNVPPRDVDLEDAVGQALQNLRLEIELSGAKVTMDSLPTVEGNETELVCLFQNLIGNAAKYHGTESPKIHICAGRDEWDWIIEVQDNGLGIAAGDYDRVFLPFVRFARREVAGTGLGLAVCRKIVERRGGRIWIEPNLPAGSRFCFTIAATKQKLAIVPKAKGAPAA
jgi:chemotaxis family two-component system sensor kinase Cph1